MRCVLCETEESAKPTSVLNVMRVLLIGDKQRIDSGVMLGFTSVGYAVDLATTYIDAFESASLLDYDIIILDCHLPGIAAIDAVRYIRSENERVPIFLLTAFNSLAITLLYFELGVDDCIVKPVSFAELLARITAVMRRVPTLGINSLRLSELRLDRFSHKVSWNGEEIKLTHKEFSLLEYLMLNPNTIISRRTITEHAWGQMFDSTDNSVDVYIRQLRKKIDIKYRQKLIQTMRGGGYSIASDQTRQLDTSQHLTDVSPAHVTHRQLP